MMSFGVQLIACVYPLISYSVCSTSLHFDMISYGVPLISHGVLRCLIMCVCMISFHKVFLGSGRVDT